jgi:hypothetical protein
MPQLPFEGDLMLSTIVSKAVLLRRTAQSPI